MYSPLAPVHRRALRRDALVRHPNAHVELALGRSGSEGAIARWNAGDDMFTISVIDKIVGYATSHVGRWLPLPQHRLIGGSCWSPFHEFVVSVSSLR